MRTKAGILLVLGASACGAHIKTEVIGTRTAQVAPRAPSQAWPAPAPGDAIVLPPGTYDLAVWFEVPRAQIVDWDLRCPSVALSGSVGETFEQYRERRVTELAEGRARHERAVAGVTSTIVGALAPRARIRTVTRTPAATVETRTTVGVDPDAVGATVARGAVAEQGIVLAPGDVGGGRVSGAIRIELATGGACTLTGLADDAGVAGHFRVTRIRDLDAEARAHGLAIREGAIQVRGTLTAALVGAGADAEARQRRLDAIVAVREARIDVELAARARIEGERRARIDAEAALVVRYRDAAYGFRAEYEAWLVGRCHADPHARERRLETQREADAELRARGEATIALHRQQATLAVATRERMTGYLVGLGAHVRPPMPPAPTEDRGPAPTGDATWVDGRWTWTGVAWSWESGGWRDDTRFVGGPESRRPVIVVGPMPLIVNRTTVIRRPPPPPRKKPTGPTVRDHR